MGENKIGQKSKINYGLNLLRIFSMFIVISFHFSDHGVRAVTSLDPLDLDWILLSSARMWGGIVNCSFMLITGYFLSKKTEFSLRRLLQLYAQVWFYSVVFGIVAEWLYKGSLEELDLFRLFCPFISNNYWYFSAYVVVYLFYPFTNRLIEALNKTQHKTLCVISIMLFSFIKTLSMQGWLEGTNWIYLFFALYFTGAYLRKYPFKLDHKGIAVIFLLVLEYASILFCRWFEIKFEKGGLLFYFVWGADKIFPVAISIVLFKFFEEIEVKNVAARRFIGVITPAVFGVYLFHIGDMYKWLFRVVFSDQDTHGIILLLQIVASMVSIFTAGILIDLIRIRFLERPLLKLLDRPLSRLETKVSSFFK